MTNVYVSRDRDKLCIKADGHATGSEVVCGIVSAVVQGLASALRNAKIMGVWTENVSAEFSPGHALVTCDGSDEAWLLFELTYITLAQVAVEEPEKLSVNIFCSPVAIPQ